MIAIKRALILSSTLTLLATWCASPLYKAYSNHLEEIEQAYQDKKISTAQYLTLKQNAENAYLQLQATEEGAKQK